MKILIAEEALQTGAGHWPSYIGGISDGLRAAGDEVDVLVHQDCSPELAKSLGGWPVFSRNCWLDASSQGSIGGLSHNMTFRRELKDWISKQETSYDYVCGLTMRVQHLLAFARLSRSSSISKKTRFVLLFVQGFGRYVGIGEPSVFPLSGTTLLARFCFGLMAKAVRSGRVVLAAETKGMQDELKRFTGLPVQLFPHPVPAPPAPPENLVMDEYITLSCPGFARHEKGTDLLQDAVLILLKEPAFCNVKFILQWPEPFALPDGVLLEPSRDLIEDSRVLFLNDNLDSESYEDLIRVSDIILLPYRRESYHNRVSRVAIEAASRGKPLIYMSGTWSAEVAEISGAGIPIEEETPEALAEAIREGLKAYETIKANAQKAAPDVIQNFSVDSFRSILLGEVSA